MKVYVASTRCNTNLAGSESAAGAGFPAPAAVQVPVELVQVEHLAIPFANPNDFEQT